jgi:hypothetical protein
MATIKKKIEFTEKELKEVLCERYNLDKDETTIEIYKSKNEEDYSIITIEGKEKNKPLTWADR